MPEVSVIMGTYNAEKRISKSIESILNQTYQDFEFIICDDASTDNTVDIIKKYMECDHRIVLLKNETNMKLSATLNKCIKASKGNYIARIDDDDIAHSDSIQIQVDFLRKHPEFDILGTSRNLYDNNGIWGSDLRNEKETTVIDIALGESFIHPSVMMRKKSLLDVNGYSTGKTVERTEDLDLWYKMFAKGFRGYTIRDVLLDYYEDFNSYSKRKYKFRICEYRVRNNWAKKLNNIAHNLSLELMIIIGQITRIIIGIYIFSTIAAPALLYKIVIILHPAINIIIDMTL
jgi:glycosyltransferase EpsE